MYFNCKMFIHEVFAFISLENQREFEDLCDLSDIFLVTPRRNQSFQWRCSISKVLLGPWKIHSDNLNRSCINTYKVK